MMETVFSVGSAPSLYKEDLRPTDNNNRKSVETAFEDD
jgi:hypothetical protein